MQEHARWCRERWMSGWTYDETRDDVAQHHPSLLPYDRLSEPLRELDRQTIKRLPGLLAELGIVLKRDCRIGIWFVDSGLSGDSRLISEVATRTIAEMERRHGAHLQLVLPLRAPAEFALAVTLARSHRVGVDVALVRDPSALVDIGPAFDRQQAQDLIAVADRAFPLAPATGGDGSTLASLCDACDVVLLASEEAEAAKMLLRQIDESRRGQIEMMVRDVRTGDMNRH
jgi:hypothetical protein